MLDIKSKLKSLFKIVKFSAVMKDGNIINVTDLVEGAEVTIDSGDGEFVAVPDGQYELSDPANVVIDVAAGKIVKITSAETIEDPLNTANDVEVEAACSPKKEKMEEVEAVVVEETPSTEDTMPEEEMPGMKVEEEIAVLKETIVSLNDRLAAIEELLAGTTEMKEQVVELSKMDKKFSKINKEFDELKDLLTKRNNQEPIVGGTQNFSKVPSNTIEDKYDRIAQLLEKNKK